MGRMKWGQNGVVVITDRRVLDKQLQDAIYQIEHAQGVVKAIDKWVVIYIYTSVLASNASK